MTRKFLWRGFGSLALAVATAASPLSASAAERPDVVVAVNELARSLDPGSESGNVDVRIYYSIFDTLIRRDFSSAGLEPGLATSWTRTSPTTLEVNLREGVTCHDGSPFNADDVLATFSPERLWGPKSYYPKGREYFAHLKSVERLGDYKVRFTTQGPDIAFEKLLSGYTAFIICDEALNAFKEAGDYTVWMEKAEKALRWNPVGTGPYKFESYQKDDHVTLAAFDNYWEGAPAAAKITFKEVPEVAARISGLVSGEYNIAVEITPDQWAALDRYDDIKQKPVVLENTHVLVFNADDSVMSDPKLRKALSLAIDRDTLIKGLWHGKTYTPKGHQLENFGDMYVEGRKGYEYDPERAKKLVAESSYKGQTLSYRLIPGYYIYNVEAAQLIQEMWGKIGVTVKLDFVESFNAVRADGAQIYAWSNTFRVPDPGGALLPLWGPEAAIQTKYKSFHAPAEFNELADKLLTTPDIKERKEQFARMLDILDEEMPFTMLYNPMTTYAMSSNIEWEPYSLYYMDFRPSNFSVKPRS